MTPIKMPETMVPPRSANTPRATALNGDPGSDGGSVTFEFGGEYRLGRSSTYCFSLAVTFTPSTIVLLGNTMT